MKSRIEWEKRTIAQMVGLYCLNKEHNRQLCPDCEELLGYALARLSRCPFGDRKTSCRKCKVHCYRPDMKERIRIVMRYAGPRMMIYHPIAAVRHMFYELR